MLIGVPKEVKNNEYRVGLVPSSVRELVAHGHQVMVEHEAGRGIGIDDAAFEQVGAKIVNTASEIFAKADMIVKVKEPQPRLQKIPFQKEPCPCLISKTCFGCWVVLL